MSGLTLNSREAPSSVQTLQGGIILKLPNTGIEKYLKENIDFSNLNSDDELCEFLELYLHEYRSQKVKN